MVGIFEEFSQIISKMTEMVIKVQLEKIYEELYSFAKKMGSSTKFIDFFVHDILDYTILNKDEKNFTKNITIFSI